MDRQGPAQYVSGVRGAAVLPVEKWANAILESHLTVEDPIEGLLRLADAICDR